MELKVIYEDNHIIVVEKPVGVPTQADYTKDEDMYNLVREYLKEKYNKPGQAFVGMVHRIDRPVGGVMVFAKTSKGASRLSEQIRDRSFKKIYLAEVYGHLENKKGSLEDYLVKNAPKNMSVVRDKNVPNAKLAQLDYEVIEEKEDTSIVRIVLHTGRHHQIRVQFSNIGHPLVGDNKYGSHAEKKRSDIHLWAYSLKFKHPTKDEIMEFTIKPDWI